MHPDLSKCFVWHDLHVYCPIFYRSSPKSQVNNPLLRYSNGYNYIFGTDYERLYKYDFIIGEVGL